MQKRHLQIEGTGYERKIKARFIQVIKSLAQTSHREEILKYWPKICLETLYPLGTRLLWKFGNLENVYVN